MRISLVLSTIVTKSKIVTKTIFLIVLLFLLPGVVWAEGSLVRLLTSVRAISPGTLPDIQDIRAACGENGLCAARIMAQIIGPKAILEKVRHPSSDQIRLVTSVKSVTRHSFNDQGVLNLELKRFGRKVVFELKKIATAVQNSDHPLKQIILDLRQNPGGDVDRMLRVTSLFTGPVAAAVYLDGRQGRKSLSVPDKQPVFSDTPLQILIGPNTKSSAEILAALLKVHGGAELIGARTFGKNYLLRVVAVSHDWRLLVPGELVAVRGINLVGGVRPDRVDILH